MRTRNMVLLVIAVVLVFTSNVFAAVQQGSNLPVYPGGKVAIELDFTNKDFLPAIREFITLWPIFMSAAFSPAAHMTEGTPHPSEPDAILSQLNESFVPELQASIAGLNHVSVVAYMVPEKVKSEQITDYYMQKIGLSKEWKRSITANDPRGSGSVRVYTKPDLEDIFAIGIQGPRVLVVKTQGKVDLTAITRLAGKLVPMFMIGSMTQQGPEHPAQDTIIEDPTEGPIEDPIGDPITEIPAPQN